MPESKDIPVFLAGQNIPKALPAFPGISKFNSPKSNTRSLRTCEKPVFLAGRYIPKGLPCFYGNLLEITPSYTKHQMPESTGQPSFHDWVTNPKSPAPPGISWRFYSPTPGNFGSLNSQEQPIFPVETLQDITKPHLKSPPEQV